MKDQYVWEALLAAQGELGEGIAVVDIEEQRYVFVNDALAAILGYSADELMAMPSFFSIASASDRSEVPLVRGDGRPIEVEVSAKPLPSLDGNCMVVIVREVTEQRRRESELAAAERRYRELVERLPIVTYVAEPGEGGRWVYVSPQIEAMFGFPRQQWLDDPALWARLVHPDDRPWVFQNEDRLQRGERLPANDYRMFTRSGEMLWVRDDAVLRSESEDGMWLLDGLLIDITDRKLAETRLQQLADHDALTGLLNRRRFVEDLQLDLALIKRGQQHSSVLVIDVDNFKDVNDSLGHHAGDELIRSVANTLAAHVREADTLARLGGDEFAVLLRGTTGDAALPVAQRLIEAVRDHAFTIAPEPVRISASGGIATLGTDGHDAQEALAAADLAMYEAKRSGRDRLVAFSPGLRTSAEERRSWAERIRTALDENQLILYQQPILDLASGEVAQRELLIRMEGADGTIATPATFLSVAERFDLVQAIDRWVVRRAIQLIADGEAAGHPLTLSVNLSGRSIGDNELFDLLAHELADKEIDPLSLVLEITETAAIGNMEEARRFAQRLASLGCRLALDDFGSGFGSFYYLKHLPVDYLKIDGDFVRNITRSPLDQSVVRSIVQIAETAGYSTIAEFVVDEPTLEVVRGLGVHLAQGFHIGVPEPVESLAVESL